MYTYIYIYIYTYKYNVYQCVGNVGAASHQNDNLYLGLVQNGASSPPITRQSADPICSAET